MSAAVEEKVFDGLWTLAVSLLRISYWGIVFFNFHYLDEPFIRRFVWSFLPQMPFFVFNWL